MIPAPPDPVLGAALARALDGDGVASLLGSRLDDLDIVSCRPVYARWKPATSCVVQYSLTLRERDSGEERDTTAHARIYADGRALRQALRPSLARLSARVARRHRNAPRLRSFAIDEVGALVQLYPVDRELRALARVSSAKTLRRRLRLDARPRLELVRYKPGRKALFRLDTSHGVFYAKVYADAAARRVALARLLADRGVPTPRPAVFLADVSLAVSPEARGRRLADARGGALLEGMRAAASALARLHDVRPPSFASADDDRTRLRAAERAVGALVPGLAGEAARIAAQVEARCRSGRTRTVLVHGDFYDDQVIVNYDGATLLDLDEARHGDLLADAATMAAHLSSRGADDAREVFLAAFGAAEGAVAPFEAAALLRLAVGPFRRLEPEWADGVQRLVRLAAQRVSPPAAGRTARVLRVPEPRVVAGELSRITGTEVEIARAEVVRSKPGRRCTLRYDVRMGARRGVLYGKVYASDRASRVYESHRRLHAARRRIGAALPSPVGCVPRLGLVALSAVSGEPARHALAAGDLAVARQLAETLHRLHHSGVVLDRTHDLAAEFAPLQRGVERLANTLPELADEAYACLGLARAGAERAWRWRSLPILRDVYEDHVLIGAHGVSFIDLDDAAMSEPAVDVANVVAHLRLLALRSPPGNGAAASTASFRLRYAELDPALDRRLLRFLVGTTLLRLAGIHGERAGGAKIAPGLLVASRRALRDASG